MNLIKQAFILAAGYGTRLRPLTLTTPKPLIEIGGRPLLDYHLQSLSQCGIDEVFINSFYLSEQIEEYAANHKFSLVVKISHEEGEILGTAGGVMKQVDNLDDIFLVIYGDNLIELDYAKLMEYASDKEFDALVVLYHEENITQKGMAVLDELGYIQEFIEKPKPEQVVSYWANAGIYIIKKHSFMQHIGHMGFADFGFDFFPKLLARGGKILGYPSRDFMIDIGTFENLAIAQERIRLL